MPTIKTFYDELGIARNARADAIKRAFKEIAKVYHPDKNPPDRQAWAHEQMSRLNFIVETLLNPSTREEYDKLVRKYETTPLVARPLRRPHNQDTIMREYVQVSFEIMTLSGKYSNCRLKMAIGAVVGGVAASLHLFGVLTTDAAPTTFWFTYFFALIGALMLAFGVFDYFGRGGYRRRIDALEERRTFLRRRMFETYGS